MLKVRFNRNSFLSKTTKCFCNLLALQQRNEMAWITINICLVIVTTYYLHFKHYLALLQSCWNVAISCWRFGMHWIVLGANIKHKFCWRKKYSHSCLSETIYHQIRKKQSSNKKRHIPLAKCKFFFQAKTKKILILFRYKSTTIRPYLEWKKNYTLNFISKAKTNNVLVLQFWCNVWFT